MQKNYICHRFSCGRKIGKFLQLTNSSLFLFDSSKILGDKKYAVILIQEPSGEYQIANSHRLRTGMYYQWYSYNMVLPQPRTGSLDEGILTTYKVLTLLETCRSSTNYQDIYILPIGFTNHNFVSCYCNQLELSIPIYY